MVTVICKITSISDYTYSIHNFWLYVGAVPVSEWVSSFLTAHKHNLGHLVPLQVKNQERKSNIITK